MDLITGLSAASQAVSLLKQLRDLDRALDEAAFKAKLIELQEMVLDARTSLLEAKEALLTKEERIRELERLVVELKSGETCPVCQNGTLKTRSVKAHPTFGEVGVQEKTLVCSNPECGHTEKRIHDPSGILGK